MRLSISVITILIGFQLHAQTQSALSVDDIMAWVERGDATDVEGVISRLPDEYLENYTLVKTSRSMQGSSPTYPRAILFGRKANLILSFNGNPEDRGHGTLEMIQFRHEQNKIEFRQIDFNKSPVEISPANPESCLRCHGKSPRPLFGTYPKWTNFYGEDLDRLDYVEGEVDLFNQYLEIKDQHPLYRYLWRDPANPYFPFQDCRVDSETEGVCWTHQYRPNDRLGLFAGFYTATMMGKDILESENYKKYPNLMFYLTLPCESGADNQVYFKTEKLFNSLFPKEEFPRLDREQEEIGFEMKELFRFGILGNRILYFAEKIFSGLDVFSWGLNSKMLPKGEVYSLGFMPFTYPLGIPIFEDQINKDPSLAAYFVPKNFSYLHYELGGNYETRHHIALGGRENDYNDVFKIYDVYKARELCAKVRSKALQELQGF
ncbi:MAG: hypothetical protein KDD25_02875 [Bdellovibrionales bacterium]|nr:hypothetical protein [Bdellovibrionales bacterium]